ncbi:MAG: hypothetical protein JSR82_19075 [Verrucomicrobia bacterium]|nr:hypothetical protein [Verrucomicrobiota bacterium]
MKSLLRSGAIALLALGFVAAPAAVYANDKCSACQAGAKKTAAKKKAKKTAKAAKTA